MHSILAVPRILARDLRCCTWDVLEPLSWSTLPSLLNVESYCSTQPPPCSELNPASSKGCLQLHCQRASVLLASCLLLLLWQLASSLPPIAVLSACFPVGKPQASYLSPAQKETFSLHFSFICTQQEVPTSTIQDDELNSFQGSCGYNMNDPMCTVTHFWLICNSSSKNIERRGGKKNHHLKHKIWVALGRPSFL